MKLRILLFEDDLSLRTLLHSVLEKHGHEVFSFPDPMACPFFDASQCNAPSGQKCFDLMIADSHMLCMGGLDLIKSQKAKKCLVNIQNKLILSGGLSRQEIDAAMNMGCSILEKPFKCCDLAAWVEDKRKRINPDRFLASLESLGLANF